MKVGVTFLALLGRKTPGTHTSVTQVFERRALKYGPLLDGGFLRLCSICAVTVGQSVLLLWTPTVLEQSVA